jgi:hypothetical protein
MVARTRRFLSKLSSLIAIAPTRSEQARLAAITIEVGDNTDLEVIREVFAGNIYAAPAGVVPAVILDIGSNVGVSVEYFRSRFPQAEIHAVEPDHHSLVALRANTPNGDTCFVAERLTSATGHPATASL